MKIKSKKIGLFYGSDTGTTEYVTELILKRIDKGGRVGAFEIMICNAAIKNLIRENKIFQIGNSMQMGKGDGQMLMENSLKELIAEGVIDPSDAEVE